MTPAAEDADDSGAADNPAADKAVVERLARGFVNGKITEQWGYSDFAEVVRHLRKVAATQSEQQSELEV